MLGTIELNRNTEELPSCTIVGDKGVHFEAVIDTASAYSLISKKQSELWDCIKVKINEPIHVVSANGGVVLCEYGLRGNFNFKGKETRHTVFLFIHDDLSCGVLLGLETLRSLRAAVDLGSDTFKMCRCFGNTWSGPLLELFKNEYC